jgi:hypothetical protein
MIYNAEIEKSSGRVVYHPYFVSTPIPSLLDYTEAPSVDFIDKLNGISPRQEAHLTDCNIKPEDIENETGLLNKNNANMSSQRSHSPAPSYHTLAPHTHTSLDPSSSQPQPTFDATPRALHRAALETPDALLSRLTISNTSHPPPRGPQQTHEIDRSRYLSAMTDDGKVRYRVTFPDAKTMRINKVVSPANPAAGLAEGIVPIASTTVSSQSLNIAFADGNVLDTRCEDLNSTQKLPFVLSVDGRPQRFSWEIVSKMVESGPHPDEEDGGMGKRRPVLGIQSKRKKEMMQRIVGMKLVDVNGVVWASYVHPHPGDNAKPEQQGNAVQSTGRSGTWGHVEIKTRAVLLDDGVDKAFVVLISLLEVYVRLFGGEHPGVDKYGGILVGVLACEVM